MRHVSEDLTALLDGALPPAEEALVVAHLQACPACRAERAGLEAALGLLSRLPPPPPVSRGFEQRFFARLATAQADRRSRHRLLDRLAWRWLGPGLAAAAAAATLVVVSGHRRDQAFLASHLELFESYEVVASVDAVETPEDVAVVEHLDELSGPEGRP